MTCQNKLQYLYCKNTDKLFPAVFQNVPCRWDGLCCVSEIRWAALVACTINWPLHWISEDKRDINLPLAMCLRQAWAKCSVHRSIQQMHTWNIIHVYSFGESIFLYSWYAKTLKTTILIQTTQPFYKAHQIQMTKYYSIFQRHVLNTCFRSTAHPRRHRLINT